MFSLILVPLLFAYFGKKEIQKFDLRVIEINAWHPDLEPMFPFPVRNYTRIILTGDNANDKPATEQAKVFIKEMYEKNDTINGIRFELQSSVSYGTVVGFSNFFKEDSITAFAIYNNNIWVLKQPDSKPGTQTELIMICGNSDLGTGYYSNEDLSQFDTISLWCKDNLAGLVKLWPTIALLFLLVALTITQLIRNFKPTIV